MVSLDIRNYRDLQHVRGIANEVTARCSACGASWRYERHEALVCPMCAAGFTTAYFTSAAPATYVDLDAVGGATGAS